MSIIEFDSTEAMFAYLGEIRDAEIEAAKERINFAKMIHPGVCFVRWASPPGVLIWGKIEKSQYEEDKESEERLQEMGRYPCTAASAMCPKGEMGLIHIGQIDVIIQQEDLDLAEEAGWPETWTGAEILLGRRLR